MSKAADYDGKPEEVSLVNPLTATHALRGLKREVERSIVDIDVTMETTHNGPTSFQVPVCFVEIGSGPGEWMNPALGRVAADAIMSAVNASDSQKPVVGFGGAHYSAKFTRMNLEGDFQVGHIVPRFAIEAGITDSVLRDTFNKTSGDCSTALIDWKGLSGEDRRQLTSKLENWGFRIERCRFCVVWLNRETRGSISRRQVEDLGNGRQKPTCIRQKTLSRSTKAEP